MLGQYDRGDTVREIRRNDVANVLITGARAGIGRATALALARAGHRVSATMRGADPGELSAIAAAENLPLTVLSMDVDSDESVSSCIAGIREPIDVLVNNAGVSADGAVEEVPLQTFRAVMETNYFGALRCIQAVLPGMREARSGCIVNISSVAGRVWCAPLTPYAASKAALEALSEALAGEVKAFNIRVAIVEPGVIDTAMARDIASESASKYPHAARFARFFRAVLTQPVAPEVVANTISEVVASGTWQLRHTSGATAGPFLQWRASMTDEEWVAFNALDDDGWYAKILQDLGVDARAVE